MRVLYFSTGYGPHDQRFLSALARTKHEVHFLRLVGKHSSEIASVLGYFGYETVVGRDNLVLTDV